MKVRSLVLAAACVLVLAGSYPAGKSAAQLATDQTVAEQQRALHAIPLSIRRNERKARTAWILGDCAVYVEARRQLEWLAGSELYNRGSLVFSIRPEIKAQLRAQAQAALDALPANCDPDSFVRNSLARDEDNARHGGSDGDAQ